MGSWSPTLSFVSARWMAGRSWAHGHLHCRLCQQGGWQVGLGLMVTYIVACVSKVDGR